MFRFQRREHVSVSFHFSTYAIVAMPLFDFSPALFLRIAITIVSSGKVINVATSYMFSLFVSCFKCDAEHCKHIVHRREFPCEFSIWIHALKVYGVHCVYTQTYMSWIAFESVLTIFFCAFTILLEHGNGNGNVFEEKKKEIVAFSCKKNKQKNYTTQKRMEKLCKIK